MNNHWLNRRYQRKVAIIRVYAELWNQSLQDLLTENGFEVVGVDDQLYFDTGDIAVKVHHPALLPIRDGGQIPNIVLQVRSNKGKLTLIKWEYY